MTRGPHVHPSGEQSLLDTSAVARRRDERDAVTRLQRWRDELDDAVDQKRLGVIKHDEVVLRPRLERQSGHAVAQQHGRLSPMASERANNTVHVLASNADGAVAQARDGEAAGADPAPDADSTDAQQSGHFRDAVVATLFGGVVAGSGVASRCGRGGMGHVFQTVSHRVRPG